MCSVTWRRIAGELVLAFNRDESRARAKAIEPEVYTGEFCDFIAPIDPQAGGTWFGVNQAGFVFGLLNNYQGTLKPQDSIKSQASLKPQEPGLISRGQIVKELLQCADVDSVYRTVNALDMQRYQAFTLFFLSFKHQGLWQHFGDNKLVQQDELPQNLFSSAHPDAAEVLKLREQVAKQWRVNSESDLIDLHRSHLPHNPHTGKEDKTYSICMHHDKGHTQSLSLVRLQEASVEVKYWAGQPCQTDRYEKRKLDLVV